MRVPTQRCDALLYGSKSGGPKDCRGRGVVAGSTHPALTLTPCSCSVLMGRMIKHSELSFNVVRLEPGGQEAIARVHHRMRARDQCCIRDDELNWPV
jgi:hypothetical protein